MNEILKLFDNLVQIANLLPKTITSFNHKFIKYNFFNFQLFIFNKYQAVITIVHRIRKIALLRRKRITTFYQCIGQ